MAVPTCSTRFYLDCDMQSAETEDVGPGITAVISSRCPDREGPNEDAAAIIPVSDNRSVLVVADGFGGHPAGARASEIAVQQIELSVCENPAAGDSLRSAIVDGFEKRRIFGRFNGHPTILLGISKDNDTDIIELVDGISAYVDEYRASVPPGIDVSLTWNQAEYVAYRLQIMQSNLVLGIAFVIFVLWLSVGFRNAMLAIIGMLNATVAIYYYLRVIYAMTVPSERTDTTLPVSRRSSHLGLVVCLGLAATIIGVGVFPEPLIELVGVCVAGLAN